MASKFYAVKKGRKTGVFTSWDECKQAVEGFSNAVYKSFSNYNDAYSFAFSDSANCNKKDENTFLEDKEIHDDVFAYIDGSYDDSKNRFSYAGIIFNNGKKVEFSNSSSNQELSQLRNVAGELHAAMYVMRYAEENNIKDITIYYDYAGIEMWATDKWKANLDFTKEYANYAKNIMKKINICFRKVKAHSGIKYNEEVDKLAKLALHYNDNGQACKEKKYSFDIKDNVDKSVFTNIAGSKSSAKINILIDDKIITPEKLLVVIKHKWKDKKRTIKEINDIKSYYDVLNKRFVVMITCENSEELIIIESSEFNG